MNKSKERRQELKWLRYTKRTDKVTGYTSVFKGAGYSNFKRSMRRIGAWSTFKFEIRSNGSTF